jgi:hypothetical protein
MAINKQNNWKSNTLHNNKGMENTGNISKILWPSSCHCHSEKYYIHKALTPKSSPEFSCKDNTIIRQHFFHLKIKLIFYFNDSCSREYTFLVPFVTRTGPVDWHIKKHISSPWKIRDWSLIVPCSYFSFTYSCTSLWISHSAVSNASWL